MLASVQNQTLSKEATAPFKSEGAKQTGGTPPLFGRKECNRGRCRPVQAIALVGGSDGTSRKRQADTALDERVGRIVRQYSLSLDERADVLFFDFHLAFLPDANNLRLCSFKFTRSKRKLTPAGAPEALQCSARKLDALNLLYGPYGDPA